MAANQGGSTVAATNWIPVMDDASLPEGGMQPAYPRGLNVVMARVDGTAYAVSGACAHMGCPIFAGSLAAGVMTITIATPISAGRLRSSRI